MYLYSNSANVNVIMKFLDRDRWYMIADRGAGGRAYLYLHAGGFEYPLLCSKDLTRKHPGLDEYRVLELYNAVIAEAFQQIKGGSECLDISEIEASLLPGYLERWRLEGGLAD